MDAKKIAIMESATTLFTEKGILCTTVDQIASNAGMTRTNVNHHFKTLGSLYNRMFEHYCDTQEKYMIKDANKKMSWESLLQAMWINRARWGLENEGAFRFLFQLTALEKYDRYDINQLVKSALSNGVKERTLKADNLNYFCNLFYTINDGITRSMIGKKNGRNQKIRTIKRAFNIFIKIIRNDSEVSSEDSFYNNNPEFNEPSVQINPRNKNKNLSSKFWDYQ